MYVARSWLEECMKNHDECHRDLRFECPRRLVDLGSLYDEEQHTIAKVNCPREINIIETSRLHKPQYLAVSYRWPDNPDMNQQLYQATESRFLDGFPTANLPRVFCDAFTAARMSGFRYIWIDALVSFLLPYFERYLGLPDALRISVSCRERGLTGTRKLLRWRRYTATPY